MTVTYTAQVATSSHGLGCFWKLLFKWRGSIYKLVWHELVVYCICYTICSLIYRFALSEPQRRIFESVALHIDQFINLIPMAFVLGFYVSIIMTRWWDQYISIPWPDSLAVFVSTNIHGQNDVARVMRRTVMRYVNLSFVITMSMISPRVKKRFPTMQHLVEMGLLTEQEQMIFEILNAKTANPKYWLPLVWAGAIVAKARKQGRIRDDFAQKTIMDELNNFRKQCRLLLSYDYVSVPIVYTQVVTLAVYTFFISTILGRQFLDPTRGLKGHTVDLYIPWFTILQFFFYMGWLKVAESLINPFGEDDDDFETNSLVDRNVQVSYLIVDEMHEDHPELIKDMYYDEVVPAALPYTVATEQYRSDKPVNKGSTCDLKVPEPLQEILDPIIEEKASNVVETLIGGLVQEKYKEAPVKMAIADDLSTISSRRSSVQSSLTTPVSRKRSIFARVAERLTSPKLSRVPSASSSIRTLRSLRSGSSRHRKLETRNDSIECAHIESPQNGEDDVDTLTLSDGASTTSVLSPRDEVSTLPKVE